MASDPYRARAEEIVDGIPAPVMYVLVLLTALPALPLAVLGVVFQAAALLLIFAGRTLLVYPRFLLRAGRQGYRG